MRFSANSWTKRLQGIASPLGLGKGADQILEFLKGSGSERHAAGRMAVSTFAVRIAGAALVAGWRGVFQLAVAVVAFRLIVLSFELASDLLLSGFGLVVAGLMILLVAFVAVRISRQFAPQTVRGDGESTA